MTTHEIKITIETPDDFEFSSNEVARDFIVFEDKSGGIATAYLPFRRKKEKGIAYWPVGSYDEATKVYDGGLVPYAYGIDLASTMPELRLYKPAGGLTIQWYRREEIER